MSLPPSLDAKVSALDTEPGWLVEILFPSGAVRLCSRGTLAWDGHTWLGWGIEISGLRQDDNGDASGQLRLIDRDGTVDAAVFADEVRGAPVRIWKVYGDTPAAGDALLRFSGIADAPVAEGGRIQIALLGDQLRTRMLPRGVIAPAAGCTHQTAPGTVITWGGERITLETAERG